MNEKGKRLEALYVKLASLGARHIAMTTGADKGPMEWYTLNGQVIIVQVFARGEGYEVYAPVDGHSNSVQDTLDALDRIAEPPAKPQIGDMGVYHYSLFDDTDNTCHGTYETLDEARGAASFDRLTAWTVYYKDEIVASHTPQPTASDRGTAAGILADPLWTAYDMEAAAV